MKLFQLTAFSLLLLGTTIFSSCEKDDDASDKPKEHVKGDIALTGAQSVPATTSPATGTLWVSYSEKTHMLDYEFNWAGLRDTIVGISIHGPAPMSFASATVKQLLPGFTNSAANLKPNQAAYPYLGGSYKGSVLIDGANLKQEELLNMLYYISIRTKAFPTTGEIRAQIRFR